MSKPTNPECEVYWAQIVCEAEDSRSQNPDDTVFFRTVLMIDAQLRHYRSKLESLAKYAKDASR